MANDLFKPDVKVKVIIDQPKLIAYLYSPTSDIGLFRRKVGTAAVYEAKRTAATRLSRVSGSRYKNWHRPGPRSQPGRTGEYDKKFSYRTFVTGGNITIVLKNNSSYADIVEIGTRRTGYSIRASGNYLYYFNHRTRKYVSNRKVVRHPGPWRSKTANSNGRSGRAGEAPGYGSYILNDSMKAATISILASYRFLGNR